LIQPLRPRQRWSPSRPWRWITEEYLGSTIAEIAAEKAAIIQPGVGTVIGPQTSEALDVIIRRCEAQGIEPTLIETSELSHPGGASAMVAAN
jgi:folylpolyglutamate synthase/dihydropteroate synthase